MNEADVLCNYCGHKWTESFYAKAHLTCLRCPICKDSNLKFTLVGDKVDYYSDKLAEDAYIKRR